ncbi:MAG: outer membrane beta-barrel protein [Bacteroidales bacterium]|nr:outer membrane beta-barrel protein [Bacteroidales bacterium]
MKRIIFCLVFAAFILFPVVASSQERVVEHNIKHGLGVFHHDHVGGFTAWSLAYGPDFYLNTNWSLMPEIEYNYMSNGLRLPIGKIYGYYTEKFKYIGLAANLRCHFGKRITLGLAPMASYGLTRSAESDSGYFSDAIVPEAWDYGGKLTADYSLSPHWRLGLEAYYGTTQIARLCATVSYLIY